MSVYVSTCTIYDFSCVEAVALIKHVFLHLVTKTSDQFLEKQINTKLCVKFGETGLWGRSYERVK